MSTSTLAATGLVMGVVHVLTGPDHLSALATLSANVDKRTSFWYGIRWGIGHSIGLITVGSIFIFLSSRKENENAGDGDDDDGAVVEVPESIANVLEVFVGLFMLALGLYSLVKTKKAHLTKTGGEENAHDGAGDEEDGSTPELQYTRGEASLSLADVANANANANADTGDTAHTNTEQMNGNEENNHGHGHGHSHDHGHDHFHLPNMKDGLSKQFLTVCIGIVHGVAGPGGVLGVIPAVQLHDPWLSTVYLGSFCIASTLIMGCFAATYGECSSRVSQNSDTLAFRMEVFSASLSILVGCLWLILLYFGILDDVFP